MLEASHPPSTHSSRSPWPGNLDPLSISGPTDIQVLDEVLI